MWNVFRENSVRSLAPAVAATRVTASDCFIENKKLYFLRFLRAQWDGWLKMSKTV